ncbi:glycine zipper 2TM domain-containing protein [Caldimonas tepidiphila]|uniref:glycine zipper 2TM domain-containing protein n=1 Tax=Caldimonas tepidiphila TaxID=2315841 RepID=UPI000E5B720B|nr:glycine zipper 2TM domain-containing protein [Caldimonas tepidiphila]
MKRSLILAGLVLALAGCSTTSPDVVSRDQAQRLQQVQDGTLLSVRDVVVEGTQSGIGAATGGVVGGLAGSSVGGGRGAVAASVLGAVAGGVLGNAAERSGTREQAVELLVQLRNGERRMIVQARGDQALVPGDPVLLVSSGGKTKVVKAR